MMMESMNAELLLNIVQYGNKADLALLSACSKRWYYLVQQYLRVIKGPELVSVARQDPETNEDRPLPDMLNEARAGLQGPPNLVLGFQSVGGDLQNHVASYVPQDCTILCAEAKSIQVNHPARDAEDMPTFEHDSKEACMMARFPDASIYPFYFQGKGDMQSTIRTLKMQIQDDRKMDIGESGSATESPHEHVKAVIIYASRNRKDSTENAVKHLQAEFPGVAVIGGVCQRGYMTAPRLREENAPQSREELEVCTGEELHDLLSTLVDDECPDEMWQMEHHQLVAVVWEAIEKYKASEHKLHLKPMKDHLFGVVLAGSVPIRSVVSCGVTSILQSQNSQESPQKSSPYVIASSKYCRPTDEDYPSDLRLPFSDAAASRPPVHLVTHIRNEEQDEIITVKQFCRIILQRVLGTRMPFLGLKRLGIDGFELCTHFELNFGKQVQLAIYHESRDGAKETSLCGTQVDFFDLQADACMRDMDRTAQQLKEQTKGEKILGAVMFNCGGRGPFAHGFIPEPMSDATRFGRIFKDVPCLGYYASAEIGPQALAGNENVFQKGEAAMQSYTVVFALFIVPVMNLKDSDLDDQPEHAADFVSQRLHSSLKSSSSTPSLQTSPASLPAASPASSALDE